MALSGCSKEETPAGALTALSISLNGATLTDGAQNVPTSAAISIVFSATIDPASFESEFSITGGPLLADPVLTYANQTSKVTIELELDFETTYTFRVGEGAIGKNGERLGSAIMRSFTTLADGIIHALPPCTEASDDCLQTVSLTADGTADLSFYASYPIYEDQAEWLDLKAAVIVVHGVNRNADDYFSYLMNALQAGGVEDEVVLIAPHFKNASEAVAGEFYWSGSDWREGKDAAGSASISSFAAVDRLIDRLADPAHFPVLEKIIVTGHSSGGLFTHLFAAANQSAVDHPELSFTYVVANSQYFYYPDGRRVNEATGQLYTPAGCTGYDLWPLGFEVVPPYLAGIDPATYNDRFVDSEVVYLLGNGSGPDNTLNTSDCYATLLGSSRYQRGENMFLYLELAYPGVHQHSRTIVEGIGHDGAAMYGSAALQSLLQQLLD